MRRFDGIDDLRSAVGTDLGQSEWIEVTQADIDLFGQVTGDRQWIHVDPVRAATGPFGVTIAHGFLTLSLVPRMISQVFRVGGLALGLNYGLNKVRFPSSVPVDSKLRGSVQLISVEDTPRGAQSTMTVVVERAGSEKPACVAEVVMIFVPART